MSLGAGNPGPGGRVRQRQGMWFRGCWHLDAGGAYVPLDPGTAAARLSYMIEDSAPRVLLTDARAHGGATPDAPSCIRHVVNLQNDHEQLVQALSENLPRRLRNKRSAYARLCDVGPPGSTGQAEARRSSTRQSAELIQARTVPAARQDRAPSSPRLEFRCLAVEDLSAASVGARTVPRPQDMPAPESSFKARCYASMELRRRKLPTAFGTSGHWSQRHRMRGVRRRLVVEREQKRASGTERWRRTHEAGEADSHVWPTEATAYVDFTPAELA